MYKIIFIILTLFVGCGDSVRKKNNNSNSHAEPTLNTNSNNADNQTPLPIEQDKTRGQDSNTDPIYNQTQLSYEHSNESNDNDNTLVDNDSDSTQKTIIESEQQADNGKQENKHQKISFKNWTIEFPIITEITQGRTDIILQSPLIINDVTVLLQMTEDSCDFGNKLMEGIVSESKVFGTTKFVNLYESYSKISPEKIGSNLMAVIKEKNNSDTCLIIWFYTIERGLNTIGFDKGDLGADIFIEIIKSAMYVKLI